MRPPVNSMGWSGWSGWSGWFWIVMVAAPAVSNRREFASKANFVQAKNDRGTNFCQQTFNRRSMDAVGRWGLRWRSWQRETGGFMQRATILLSSAIIFVASAAMAGEWTYGEDEDAMTDIKTAYFGGVSNDLIATGLGFKCWKSGETQMRILTPVPYSDDLVKGTKAQFRIDKNEPIDVFLMLGNFNGRISFMTAAEHDDVSESNVGEILRQMRQAKRRIAVAVADKIVTFEAGNAAKMTEKFVKRCDVQLENDTAATGSTADEKKDSAANDKSASTPDAKPSKARPGHGGASGR